ncbi:unnamed protein product [Urochloa humidicola]
MMKKWWRSGGRVSRPTARYPPREDFVQPSQLGKAQGGRTRCTPSSAKGDQTMTGMIDPMHNPFTVLYTFEEEELEELAFNCGVQLGDNTTEIAETINAMKLEELARAALAEANYNQHREKVLADQHVLEGENLELGSLDNSKRDHQKGGETKKGEKKGRGSKLSRELKRISLQ